MIPRPSLPGWKCLVCAIIFPYPVSIFIGVISAYVLRDCGLSKSSIGLVVDTLVIGSLLLTSLFVRLKLFGRTFCFVKSYSLIPLILIALFLLPVFAWKRSVECVSPYYMALAIPWRSLDYLRLVVMVPLAEEFYFRGLLLDAFMLLNASVKTAILCQTIVFVVIHQLLNPIGIVWTSYVGIAMGVAAARYGLVYAILLHFSIILILID